MIRGGGHASLDELQSTAVIYRKYSRDRQWGKYQFWGILQEERAGLSTAVAVVISERLKNKICNEIELEKYRTIIEFGCT